MFTRCSLDEGGTRLSACGHDGGYSVVVHHHPHPVIVTRTPGQSPHHTLRQEAHRARPRSVRLEAVRTSRQVITPVPLVYLFVMLAAHAPSDSAGPPRLRRGCFPPNRSSPRPDCPQLHGTALRHAPR